MSKITTQKKEKKRAEFLKEMRELHGPDFGKECCSVCGKMFEPAEIIHGQPDPYASEINGDNTPVDQCQDCYQESCRSV